MKLRTLESFSGTGSQVPEHVASKVRSLGEHLLRVLERERLHSHGTLLVLKPDYMQEKTLHLTVDMHLRLKYGELEIERESTSKLRFCVGPSRSHAQAAEQVIEDTRKTLRQVVIDCLGLAQMIDVHDIAAAA